MRGGADITVGASGRRWGTRRVLALMGVLLVALGWSAAARHAPASAAGSAAEPRVEATVAPDNAPGQTLTVQRVVVAPGERVPAHYRLGTQVSVVRSGTLRVRVVGGTAEVAHDRGEPDVVVPPAQIRLRPGDALVEGQDTVTEAANRGTRRVVLEVTSLLRDGAPLTSPAGSAVDAVATWEFSVALASQQRTLFQVGPAAVNTFGWNRLAAPTTIDGQPVTVDMLANVDYRSGSGPFFGFFVITFPDGATVGVGMNGRATSLTGGTDTAFAATLQVLGGTGRFEQAAGSGTFSGYRRVQLGGTADLDVTLWLEHL